MKAGWEPIIGGWIRGDKKFFVEWVNIGHELKAAKARRRIKGNTPMANLDVKGRPGVRRSWMTPKHAMKAIDKEFPMTDTDVGNWEYQNNGTWRRKDNEFVVQRGKASLVRKYLARWNVGGTDDNWTTMKTKNGRNIRAWASAENAREAIDKEFPMKKENESSNTEEKSPEKTRVNMSFIFDGRPAEATRVISMFLSGKNINNLDLKVEGYDPKPVLDLRRGR